MKKSIFTIALALFAKLVFTQNYRYVNNIFPASDQAAAIVYGTAPFIDFPYSNENNTTIGDLVMDIYTPQGDGNTNRPAIIFAHSGGFATGNRSHDDMVAFCDSLARKGYVTATIDYRQGFYVLSNAAMHSTRAAYRGLQDGRAAIRFLKANAATYGIDPSKVYFAGSSAGAFIALHSIYMDEPAEKPADAGTVSYSNFFPPFFYTTPDLGGYDVGDHLAFDGTPAAILSLWGAVEDTALISANNDEPAFFVHGTDDGTVPFEKGNPFGVSLFPEVHGSSYINTRLDNLGLSEKETYFVNGEDHEFHGTNNGTWSNGIGGNAYWDTIVQKTVHFFWNQHKPTADFDYLASDLTLDFTDTSTGANAWHWDFGDGETSPMQNPSHTFDTCGEYRVLLYVENDILSWDTISYLLDVKHNAPPICTNLTSPVDGADHVPVSTELSWAAADNSVGYRLSVGTTSGGNDILDEMEVGGAANFELPDDLPYNSTIYVKLIPYNCAGDGLACLEESFSTEICTPGLEVTGTPLLAGDYFSTGDLTAHTATIASGTAVNFFSDTGVLLDYDFEVEMGAVFKIFLQGCP